MRSPLRTVAWKEGWRWGTEAHLHSLLSPQYGKKKLNYLPYNHQHEYFFLSECENQKSPAVLSAPISSHTLLKTAKWRCAYSREGCGSQLVQTCLDPLPSSRLPDT